MEVEAKRRKEKRREADGRARLPKSDGGTFDNEKIPSRVHTLSV